MTPYEQELSNRGIHLPCVLCQIRTEDGRKARSQDVDVFKGKFLTPRPDELSGCLTGVQKDNLIITKTNNMKTTALTYNPDPTKENLLEFFDGRVAVRKMTEREALRLMDVDEEDIDKILNAKKIVTLKNGETKVKKAISKTAAYKLAGNSIVVAVLERMLINLLTKNACGEEAQLTLSFE